MGEMKRTMFATFLALLLLCTAIPVFAVPEYTEEQAKAEMEKELEEQGDTLGWHSWPLPNKNTPEVDMEDHDIAPRLVKKYHWGITQWYNVKHEIISNHQDSFYASWTDKFYLKDKQDNTFCPQEIDRSGIINGKINGQNYTYFKVQNFQSPKKCAILTIHVIIDYYNEIGVQHDARQWNNHDQESSVFWYLTWQDEEPPEPPE